MNKTLLFVALAGLGVLSMLAAQCPPPAILTTVPTKPVGQSTKFPEGTKPPGPTTSPQQTQAGKTSVVFWHTQTKDNKAVLEKVCADFTKETGIIVVPEYVGDYPKLYQKITAAIQAGNPPDMAVAYESKVAEYMKAGAVVELDPYINDPQIGLTKDDMADIWPGYIETNRFPAFGNKTLSFPFTKSILVMYYNLDMLKKAGYGGPPKTWDQFKEVCLKVTKGDVIGYEVSVDASTIDGWIYSRGGRLLNDDNTQVLFNQQPGIASFQLIKDLVDAKACRQVAKPYGDQQSFGAQKSAFTMGSISDLNSYITEVGGVDKAHKAAFDWGLTIIPQVNETATPVTVLYGANICVFKTTPEKQKACWQFIKYFTSIDQTARWAIGSGYMPVRQSAADTEAMKKKFADVPQYKQAFDILQYSRPEPNILGWQDTRTYLQDALTAVITGQKEPKTALDDAARWANQAIQGQK